VIKENRNETIITIILAIVISLAAITVMYVSLPNSSDTHKENNTNGELPAEETILTLIHDDQTLNYTLSDLEGMEAYSGSGSYIKSKLLKQGTVLIQGSFNFTGIKVSTLLNGINDLPSDYNITVTSSDGWTNEFTKDQVNGIVNVYNETGNVTGTSGATMILAYKEDGEYITDEEIGPLRIAFVGEGVVTLSSDWAKMVVSIEVIEV